jgi:hypothetical protein
MYPTQTLEKRLPGTVDITIPLIDGLTSPKAVFVHVTVRRNRSFLVPEQKVIQENTDGMNRRGERGRFKLDDIELVTERSNTLKKPSGGPEQAENDISKFVGY